METLAQAIDRLRAAGFREDFDPTPLGLRAATTGVTYEPESLTIHEVVRFEGLTDPADESILFALRCAADGVRGTYAAAYGPAIDRHDSVIIHRLGHAHTPPRGASPSYTTLRGTPATPEPHVHHLPRHPGRGSSTARHTTLTGAAAPMAVYSR